MSPGIRSSIVFQKDVTLLARGKWYGEIKRNGLSIHNYFGRKTNVKISVINWLRSDDRYDVIFVVVRHTQIDSVVQPLKDNASRNIVFVGNNLKTDELTSALLEKTVLFAFAMSAGHREKEYIKSVSLNKITVGNTKGTPSQEFFIRNVFSGTNFKVVYESNMTDWLICHAAQESTTLCQGNRRRVAEDA